MRQRHPGGRTPAASLSSPPDPYSVSRMVTPPPLSCAHIHLAWGNAGEIRTKGIPEGGKEDLLENRQRGLLTSTWCWHHTPGAHFKVPVWPCHPSTQLSPVDSCFAWGKSPNPYQQLEGLSTSSTLPSLTTLQPGWSQPSHKQAFVPPVPSACKTLGDIFLGPSLSSLLVQLECHLIRRPFPGDLT